VKAGRDICMMQCVVCEEYFVSSTKRKTCSLSCSRVLMVSVRTAKGNYVQQEDQKEKIKKGVNNANRNLLSEGKPIEKYRNLSASQLQYDEFGILTYKECKYCKELKSVSEFRLVKNSKASKTGLVTYCKKCEKVKKTESRRKEGRKEQWTPRYVCEPDGSLKEKECSECHMLLLASSFNTQSMGRWGKRSKCKRCEASQSYMEKYGIDMIGKERAYKEQDGKCLICAKKKLFDELFIDHYHSVKKGEFSFRGLLCNECNWAYGVLGDGNENTLQTLKGILLYYCRTKSLSFATVLSFITQS